MKKKLFAILFAVSTLAFAQLGTGKFTQVCSATVTTSCLAGQDANGNVVIPGLFMAGAPSTQAGTGATQTLTTANVLTPLLVRSAVNSSGCTDTTPTAAALVAAATTSTRGAQVNSTYHWIVQNTTAGAYTATVAGGSGVTVVGTATVAHLTSRIFLVQFTDVTPGSEAVTITSIGSLTY